MTLAELLKAQSIGDDVIKTIQDQMKENKIFIAGEENLDIRYGKLKTDHDGVKAQLTEAQKLIEDMKKSAKGNESLQEKISAYEKQVSELQEQIQQERIESAIKVGLLSEHALDVDYLTFKLKEKGALELDENGKIKGWDDKMSALKTQLPNQFEGTGRRFEEHKLPDDHGTDHGITKEAFAKMGYQERLKLFNEDPSAYAEMNK